MRSNAILQQTRGSNRARVVHAGRLVELADAAACLGEKLLEAVAVGGARRAILDHADDLRRRARADIVAGVSAVVRLHQTGIGDAVVCGWGADAAVGFLHDDGEDEALVYSGGLGDGLDGRLEGFAFLVGVVFLSEALAGLVDDVGEVGGPHGLKVNPLGLFGPALGGITVSEEGLDVLADNAAWAGS